MRGGDRVEDFVTTDLLAVWTDPDTAMEAVGASRGIFDDRPAAVRRVLATDSPLRRTLYAALLALVDRGALEKRATADGRYAFRWRDGIAAPGRLVDIDLTIPDEPDPEPTHAPATVLVAPRAPTPVPRSRPLWERVVVPAAPLLFPAISCILAIVAFVRLDAVGGVIIASVLTVVGVVGLLRRVPFAGLWILGVLVAGVLLRFS